MGMQLEDIVRIVPDRPGQDMKYWLDSTRIQTELGWRQIIDLDGGIATMIEWGRQYLDRIRSLPSHFQFQA